MAWRYQVPEFWDWLRYKGTNGHVKIPFEIYEEIRGGSPPKKQTDLLYEWIQHDNSEKALTLEEEIDPAFSRSLEQPRCALALR